MQSPRDSKSERQILESKSLSELSVIATSLMLSPIEGLARRDIIDLILAVTGAVKNNRGCKPRIQG